MIAIPEADDVPVARVCPRQHHGHVVGLRPRVDEVDTLEAPWHAVRKLLSILCNLIVQINGCRVLQQLALSSDCGDDLRMAMA